ncbi:CpaD family pilus assembly protein [Sphingomonas sp. H39-1-10]|nr:CpaD family pilus assembly protein [Sphingomonas pollutisoli]MDF0488482.1 CpaD family pilus assembly protein [Sphingomonas pollutisoli]
MSMRKHLILIAALTIGGCTGTQNRGLESVHQPVVARTDYVFDAATSGDALAPGEAQRLAGWMASMRLGYGDHVAVDDPGGLAVRAHEQIAAQVARYGLLVTDDAPTTDAPVTPGMVRVVISRMKASVPGCPDFSRVGQPDFENHTGSNQGCAINANLAAMVANPMDLVRGQSAGSLTDTASATKAIDSFRKTVPTGAGGLMGGLKDVKK